MLNDPRIAEFARHWAERLWRELPEASPAERIDELFQTAFGRAASSQEIARAEAYLAQTKASLQARQVQFDDLQRALSERQTAIHNLLEPVRARLLAAQQGSAAEEPQLALPQPTSAWDFDADAHDSKGHAPAALQQAARLEAGALIVADGGYAITPPLPYSLREKTMQVWVRLHDLEQRGGGVMSVQSQNGAVFDAIVFGEKDPRQWLSGSNNFARTQGFAGPAEDAADQRPVHLAIVYHADGRISGYRNGAMYGQAYQSNGPQEFPAGETVVTFGLRHLPSNGNRLLSGQILRAELYDRALTSNEIATSAGFAMPAFVSDAQAQAELSDDERQRLALWQQESARLQQQLDELGDQPPNGDELTIWSELARALFVFKEFIYVR